MLQQYTNYYAYFLLIAVNTTTTIVKNNQRQIVDVKLNEFCQGDQNYTLLVSFGVFDDKGKCEVKHNEQMDIKPGVSVRVELDTGRISEEQGQEYCANVIVNSTAGLVTSKWKLIHVQMYMYVVCMYRYMYV